jgi:hypothetical protein
VADGLLQFAAGMRREQQRDVEAIGHQLPHQGLIVSVASQQGCAVMVRVGQTVSIAAGASANGPIGNLSHD